MGVSNTPLHPISHVDAVTKGSKVFLRWGLPGNLFSHVPFLQEGFLLKPEHLDYSKCVLGGFGVFFLNTWVESSSGFHVQDLTAELLMGWNWGPWLGMPSPLWGSGMVCLYLPAQSHPLDLLP